jgi:hypothetical protein
MAFEGVSQTVESREQELARAYHDVVLRYEALKDASPEAHELMFRDRVAETDDERAVATLTLQEEALANEAEALAQKSVDKTLTSSEQRSLAVQERSMRMLEQVTHAELAILGVYCDALRDSGELAAVIREDHPWVEKLVHAANGQYDQQQAA